MQNLSLKELQVTVSFQMVSLHPLVLTFICLFPNTYQNLLTVKENHLNAKAYILSQSNIQPNHKI